MEQHDDSFGKLWEFTEEVASNADQRICEIKQAIQENIDKIDQFDDITALIKREVSTQIREALQAFKMDFKKECGEQMRRSSQTTKNEIHDIINRNTHDFAYKNLQDQAFFNRHNLVIRGIRNMIETVLLVRLPSSSTLTWTSHDSP